jgi:hypothetical protein
MSELVSEVRDLKNLVLNLTQQVHDLTILTMKNKVDDTWIEEEIAATMVGFEDSRAFRRKIVLSNARMKKGETVPYPWSMINYRSSNGRKYQYSKKSIQKFKDITSTQA